MAYVTVEDESAAIELLCFSRCLEISGAYFQENQLILATGKLSVRDEKAPQLMCDTARALDDMEDPAGPSGQEMLFLRLPGLDHPKTKHMRLVFSMFPGNTPVKMRMADTRKIYQARIRIHPALLREAREILGDENVVIRQA